MCNAARLAYQVWEMVDTVVAVGLGNQAALPEHQAMIEQVRPCLDHWFGETLARLPHTVVPQAGPISERTLLALRDQLQAIAFAFLDQFGFLAPRAIGIECESSCTGNKIAYTWTKPTSPDFSDIVGSDIHICPLFWERDARSQTALLLHEMSHLYAQTSDIGYVSAPATVGGVIAPIYDTVSGVLTSEERLRNAPTYEGFFRCMLSRLGW